jgi:thioredoxin 1
MITVRNEGPHFIAVLGMTALLASATLAVGADPPKLPRLVDLGADKCIPCKMMAPVLKELKAEYAGRMEVEFIDVWKNPDGGKPYKIKLIPTQIFFDAAGKELFRHEGFFGKEDILAKWKELGVDLQRKTTVGIGKARKLGESR